MKGFIKLLTFISILFIITNKVRAESLWEKTSIPTPMIISVEQTPWGVLAGELAGATTKPNGIYLSRDLGNTWTLLGLSERGVIDIKYYQGKIYATTYYSVGHTSGLFVSDDKGATWRNIGPRSAPTKVTRDSKTIYLGQENAGLYISQDEGQTWIQKMGSGVDGTKVYSVESSEDIAFATTLTKVFKSTDKGDTWTEITELSNKGIMFFCINGNVIFAGSSGTNGLYLSTDTGKTWRKVQSFGNYAVGNITHFNNRYYIGRENPLEQSYSVYYTPDLGETWINTHLDTPAMDRTFELTWIHSDSFYIFSAVYNNGVYRYKVPKEDFLRLPIFNVPWDYENTNELVDNITSYFDHSYPLLGYIYHLEPEDENTTTLNFLGIKNTEPYIYYSSHSGTDFALKYGTEIKAPLSGYATYYYCKACGNTIKIDHLNDYQTIYMHLQDDDLVTKSEPVWVNNDDIIGKVGMTGNTTGPHLHFEVLKDVNASDNFLDDYPNGRVDPFGWQSLQAIDPWKKYFWIDSLGEHQGTESIYLWKNGNEDISKFITSNSNEISVQNKKATFIDVVENITTKMTPYIKPITSVLNYPQNLLKYLEATSFLLEAFDQLGHKQEIFSDPVKIEVLINQDQLSNLILDTIQLYFWNETQKIWESIPSTLNPETGILTSLVSHLSWFAVFGEKIDSNPPKTEINVSGDQNNGWFSELPTIILSPTDAENSPIGNILYSVNNGDTWSTYSQPFLIQKEGIINLLFKSQDINDNIEDAQNYVIKVNTLGKTVLKKRVLNSTFEIL
ncbi:MAG: peptidoglycan DD-metalloendopeptidase family protein [Patescibacteria group bacterium]